MVSDLIFWKSFAISVIIVLNLMVVVIKIQDFIYKRNIWKTFQRDVEMMNYEGRKTKNFD